MAPAALAPPGEEGSLVAKAEWPAVLLFWSFWLVLGASFQGITLILLERAVKDEYAYSNE